MNDHSGSNAYEHNSSKQQHVIPNSDPALDTAHEHHHGHLHHDAFAEEGREDEVAYSQGTTFERTMIPNQDPMDHNVHRRKHPEGETGKTSMYNIEDTEKGEVSSDSNDEGFHGHSQEKDPRSHHFSHFYVKYRWVFHLLIFLLFTGWWIASLLLHRNDKNWIIPFLLWGAITLRLLFFHVPITIVTKPMHFVWDNTGVRVGAMIPERVRVPAGALLTIAVILIGSFVSEESADNTRANRAISLFGLVVFLFLLWATSRNRKLINWHTVIVGMLIQFIIALFVLRTGAGFSIFGFISELARDLLGFAKDGVAFLTTQEIADQTYFFFSVIPAIIFFVSLVSVLYYWGFLQWFIGKAAIFFFWSMRISGAEAVVAAASPFIGQGESAMLIRPFVAHLTMAELHQVMTSGFATIAGSVLVAYLALGVNGQALISSCVMSIPASLAISHLRWPETEQTLTAGRVVIPDDDEHKAANSLHAFANGAWLGLKIAGMILSTLLCIIALVGLINGLLTWWGRYINIGGPGDDPYNLTLQLILGYVFYPVSFLLGVSRDNNDLILVARLIGTKVVQNEFVAYSDLQTNAEYAGLSPRSRLIATYALCGFGNLGSLGTQIGVLSQISPGRSGDVSRVAMSALISGIISTLTSASIAGLIVTDQRTFFTPGASR